jgi:hypothetical protein
MLLLLCNATFAQSGTPTIREKHNIVIDGIEETWQLEWSGATSPVCEPEGADWITCPCTGFAFGESGDLYLVRKRTGHRDERLSLTQLFSYADETPSGQAVLRRWDVLDEDHDLYDKTGLAERVRKRKIARVMDFADYDHDGRSTEFILQIGTLPCGKQMSVVVGISRSNPHLHAFTSTGHPQQPLIMQAHQWESLRTANGPVKTVGWQCGDHGGEEEYELELNARNGKIFATQRTYTCPETGRGKLIGQEDY